jgi:hypothetical protein
MLVAGTDAGALGDVSDSRWGTLGRDPCIGCGWSLSGWRWETFFYVFLWIGLKFDLRNVWKIGVFPAVSTQFNSFLHAPSVTGMCVFMLASRSICYEKGQVRVSKLSIFRA